jgi:putative flippase GtrA
VGMTISDTQTGLRAIPTADVKTLVGIYGDRFEYETNMLLAMKEKNIAFDEVKIRTVYIEENKSSHFRVIRDSWRIYKLILAHFFKYTVSSLVSSVVEIALVWAFTAIFNSLLAGAALTAVVTGGSRLLSSIVNFFMNKKLVFRSKVATGTAMVRYALLMALSLGLQFGFNELFYTIFSIGGEQEFLRTVVHVLVMSALFVMNYFVQQRWVFAGKKTLKKEGKSNA